MGKASSIPTPILHDDCQPVGPMISSSLSPLTNSDFKYRAAAMSEVSVAAMLLPELLDIVFENLQASESRCVSGDDPDWPAVTQARKQLNACTLVSRLWYPIAHRHLFRDLVYSFQNPPAGGVATWSNWGTSENPRWASPPLIVARSPTDRRKIWRFDRLPLKTLQMFSDFFEQSPHSRSSVRSLRLVMYPRFKETDWPLTMAAPPEARDMIDPALFLSFMSGLPQLEYLQTWNILVALPRTPDALIPPISVRELGVVNNFFTGDSQTVYNLMTYFGHIDRLVFYRPRWTNFATITEKSHPSIPLNVRTLDIYLAMNEISLIIIPQLLRRSSLRSNLNGLTLDNVGRWGVAGVAVLIHDLGPQLEYFNLTIYPGTATTISKSFGVADYPQTSMLNCWIFP